MGKICGKDLWKTCVLTLDWKGMRVLDGVINIS